MESNFSGACKSQTLLTKVAGRSLAKRKFLEGEMSGIGREGRSRLSKAKGGLGREAF